MESSERLFCLPGKDAVDRGETAGLSRHITAKLGQDNKCARLPQKSGLSAHVGPRNKHELGRVFGGAHDGIV